MRAKALRLIGAVLACVLPVALGGAVFTRGRALRATQEMRTALERGDYKAVRRLAPIVADADVQPTRGMTPLLLALEYDDLETARLLLSRGANANGPPSGNQGAPLNVAVKKANVEAVQLLLAHGAQPNAPNGLNITPFTEANRYLNVLGQRQGGDWRHRAEIERRRLIVKLLR